MDCGLLQRARRGHRQDEAAEPAHTTDRARANSNPTSLPLSSPPLTHHERSLTIHRHTQPLSLSLSQIVLGSSAFRVCVPGFIDRLEQRLSVPVVTSTQAFFWYMLNQVGVEDPIDGYGSLFAGRVASPPPAVRSSAPISFEEGLASLDDGPRQLGL